MQKLKLKLAQLLAGKDNIIVPVVPTDRMRIGFMAQLSNNVPFNRAYKSMMMLSPNYKDEPEKAPEDADIHS